MHCYALNYQLKCCGAGRTQLYNVVFNINKLFRISIKFFHIYQSYSVDPVRKLSCCLNEHGIALQLDVLCDKGQGLFQT